MSSCHQRPGRLSRGILRLTSHHLRTSSGCWPCWEPLSFPSFVQASPSQEASCVVPALPAATVGSGGWSHDQACHAKRSVPSSPPSGPPQGKGLLAALVLSVGHTFLFLYMSWNLLFKCGHFILLFINFFFLVCALAGDQTLLTVAYQDNALTS